MRYLDDVRTGDKCESEVPYHVSENQRCNGGCTPATCPHNIAQQALDAEESDR